MLHVSSNHLLAKVRRIVVISRSDPGLTDSQLHRMQHDDDDDADADADGDGDGDDDDDDDYYYDYYDYDYVCCGSCSSPENGGAEPTVLKINFE